MANTRYSSTELAAAVAIGIFETGKTVTIEVYDAATGNAVAVDTNACTEIGTTGMFTWAISNLTTEPTSFVQYAYVMTDNSAVPVIRREMVDLTGWSDTLPSQLLPADICKVYVNVFDPNGSETADPNYLFSDSLNTYAKLKTTYYSSSRYFTTEKIKPSYDQNTGQAYWNLPQGSVVNVLIEQLGIDAEITIPASDTADLNSLIV